MDSDSEPHSNDEYTSASAADEQEFTSHGGGMFAGSQNFVVAGGTFTNLTTNYVAAPAVPTDLRMIPLGDIDLQQQLSIESGSGIIGRRRERRCVRRVHSANIGGRGSNVTVAMYEGNRAEEDWRTILRGTWRFGTRILSRCVEARATEIFTLLSSTETSFLSSNTWLLIHP
ncbi:hypothetical protein C8R46DRAFT_242634 [Mycena filopes]|nr:hypothetical protein C8R46DRAFT_242634 [Mycena filopes]